jgi:hypothetical protein
VCLLRGTDCIYVFCVDLRTVNKWERCSCLFYYCLKLRLASRLFTFCCSSHCRRKGNCTVSWSCVLRFWFFIFLHGQYLLTPWSRVLLEKLAVPQLVKNFPVFYGTRSSITVFTRARHLPLS